MRPLKTALNLILLSLIWYFGFVIFSGGELCPINWTLERRQAFIWILFASVLAYGIITAEPPNYKR